MSGVNPNLFGWGGGEVRTMEWSKAPIEARRGWVWERCVLLYLGDRGAMPRKISEILHAHLYSLVVFDVVYLGQQCPQNFPMFPFFFFFSDNAHSSELSNVVHAMHGRCA